MSIQKLQNASEKLDNITQNQSSEFVSLVADFKSGLASLKQDIDSAREEGRNLRIAIVGQMKAGKSTALNTIFFGEDVLPKAATPMTAALTKIAYAPQNSAEVVFYTAEDWSGIEQKAKDYQQAFDMKRQELIEKQKSPFNSHPIEPSAQEIDACINEELRAANEVVQKVKETALSSQISNYLGKKESIPNIQNKTDIAGQLENYVGASGKFTPITKMTELYVNDDDFKDIEIYDTPGFNDPVVSRGAQTRSFLAKCDVIFLFSPVSQFFAEADLKLLRQNLSAAGISGKAIYLVGTQLDIALRQDRKVLEQAKVMAQKYPENQRSAATIPAMIYLINKNMTNHAYSTLDNHLTAVSDNSTKSILHALRHANPPIFISAWSWSIAHQLETTRKLTNSNQEELDKLNRDTGFVFSSESLRQLSNIETIKGKILEQKNYKSQLLSEKESNLINGRYESSKRILQDMIKQLDNNKRLLEQTDIEKLAKEITTFEQSIQNNRIKIDNIFDAYMTRIMKETTEVINLLKDEADNIASPKINISIKSEFSHSVSTSKFYNPFSWGDKEDIYKDVTTYNASAQDAIEEISLFAQQNRKKLQEHINNVMQPKQLKEALNNSVMSMLDLSSASVNVEVIIEQVENTINRLSIPNIDFGYKDYSEEISNFFGTKEAQGHDEINQLTEYQKKAITSIILDIREVLDQKMTEIEKKVDHQKNKFNTLLVKDLNDKVNHLKQQLKNKEQSLIDLDNSKKELKNLLSYF